MSEKEKSLQSSPQLVFNEQQDRIAVVLSEKETVALYKKSQQTDYSFDTLQEVYRRGYLSWDLHLNESPEQTAFNRVNSFISGGFAAELDEDLINELSPQLIGKVSNARTIGGKPSKTVTAASTLDRAAKKAWLKSKVGLMKEGDVIKTKFAVKNMQKRGIEGPRPTKKDDLDRNWAINYVPKTKDKDTEVSYHGTTARFHNKKAGTHFDVKGGAHSAHYGEPVSLKQDKVKKKTGNITKFSSFKNKIKKEEVEVSEKKPGLWDNIHAKRERIKAGSGERMRKPGSKGAPTDASIKASQTEDTDPCWQNYKQVGTKIKNGRSVPNCVPKEEYTGAEKASKNIEDPASRFVGTDELTNTYKNATPGQKVKKVVKEVVESADAYLANGRQMLKLKRLKAAAAKQPQMTKDQMRKEFEDAMKNTAKKVVKEVVEEKLYEMYNCGCNKCGEIEESGLRAKHKSPSGGLTQAGRDYYNRTAGANLKAPVTTKPSKLKKGSKSANRRKSFCARMGGMKKRLTSAKTANDPDSRINKALRKWNC